MAKDYLCKNCIHNNNGWCNKLKKQGLKQITSCEEYKDKTSSTSPSVNNDILNIVDLYQQPIKNVSLDDRFPKENENYTRKDNMELNDLRELLEARTLIECHYEWRKWSREIPYIKFPGNWEVKAIPPFGGAIIRYVIKHENSNDDISIYLDCYGELGAVGEPYWELYPDIDGDAFRCGMNDIDDLLEKLHTLLDRYD